VPDSLLKGGLQCCRALLVYATPMRSMALDHASCASYAEMLSTNAFSSAAPTHHLLVLCRSVLETWVKCGRPWPRLEKGSGPPLLVVSSLLCHCIAL